MKSYPNYLSALCAASHFLFTIEFDHIHTLRVISDEMLAKIVGSYPGKIIAHIPEAMALSREDEKVKTLVGFDERVG